MYQPHIKEVKTISRHQTYHGWPTIALLREGPLFVVASAGREGHVCPFGQVHLIRSDDSGETWTEPELLVNGPLDDRDAGVIQTSQGAVLVNWFTSMAALRRLERAEAEGSEAMRQTAQALGDAAFSRWQKVRALLSKDVVERELGTWIIRSTDGGRTWSEKIDCGVGSPHGPTELSDGRLVFVGNEKAAQYNPERGSRYGPALIAAESGDDGLSWKKIGGIPQRPGDAPGTYHEPHAVQASDGRIIVHIRNHSEQDKGILLQSESSDGGKTFSVPEKTNLSGFPAHLLRLRDGRLLSTFSYRAGPWGNRAAISSDDGKSWSDPFVLDEDPEKRDLGYPATVELEDGSFRTVWYEKLPGQTLAVLRLADWTLD